MSTAGGRIDNTGQVVGGAGGAGGPDNYHVGNGGDGGNGIVMTQGGVLFNRGEVRSGNGGASGATTFLPGVGTPGLGGVGVDYTGNNDGIINSGVIAGGLSGAGVQADAIRITGNNNSLELQAGYSIVGNVVASGIGNALELGGATDASFDAGRIGAGAQYRGFTLFNKTGTSTWTLTGSTTATTPWTLSRGTLSVASDGSLGATAGTLNLQGGVLLTTASFSSGRAVILGGAGGGGINTTSGTTLTLTGPLSGGADWSKTGAGTLVLAGANSATGITFLRTGTLQVGDGGTTGSLGSGPVTNSAALVFNRSDTLTVGNVISGTGTVTQAGTGTTVLTGANTYTGPTTVSAGTLQIGNGSTTGTLGTGPVTNNAALVFRRSNILTVGSAIGGTGTLTQAGTGTLVLTGPNNYAGATTISAGTLQIGNGGASGSLGSGAVTNNASLVFNRSGTLVASSAIGGTGTVTQAGTGTTVLAGNNTYAGPTTVSAGTLQIGNGGTTGSLGTGAVNNNAALAFNRSDTLTVNNAIGGVGTLTQAGTGITVFTATNSYTGRTTLSAGTLQIGDGGITGSLGSGPVTNNGSLVFNRSNTVILNNAISGTGTLTQAGSGTLLLTGINNTYTGDTLVQAGTLRAGSTNTLSLRSGLRVDGPAAFDMSGFDQRVTSLTGAGTVRLTNATLNLGFGDSSSNFSGTLSGTGSLVKTGGGTLTLSGNNTYGGGTALKNGRIDVGSSSALGTGALAMDDGTALGFAADSLTVANAIQLTGSNDPVIDTGSFDGTLSGGIAGFGFLTKEGSGTLTLAAANNTYSGDTNVAAGTLRAGATNAFSATSRHSVAAGATLDTGGFNQTIAGLANSGTVSLVGSAPGSTLTVEGFYVGNGGVLRLGTALGDSASVSDRLVLSGPGIDASGSTTVQITNLGGLGGFTTGNGIQVIGTALGASIQPGAFALAGGHVDAGAFEYRLNLTAGGGYLSNLAPPPLPALPQAPTPTPAVDPAVPAPPAAAPAPAPAISLPLYRAEVPLFAALPEQLRQGNLAMLGNLHLRRGDDDLKTDGAAASSNTGERRAWGRVLSTNLDIRQQGTVSPSSHGRLTGFQAGTDLFADTNWRAGLYVGRLDGDMQVSGFARGIANLAVGSNSLNSEYLGAYGTYSADNGFHADAVLQGGRHRYDASPGGTYFASHGKATSVLASIEVGQALALSENWKIEPQLQYVHQRLSMDDVSLAGATVRQDGNSRSMLRAGVRLKGQIATGIGALQPYVRVNLYRRAGGSDIANFVGPAATTAIATRTGGTSTELAAGATLALNDRVSLYGELGKLWASGGSAKVSSSVQASVGARFRW